MLAALLLAASLAAAPDKAPAAAPPPASAQPSSGTQPSTAQPPAAQPSTPQPSTAQPSTAQPSTAQPSTAQPSSAQPSSAQPSSAQPSSAKTIKIAAAGLEAVDVDPKKAQFLNDYLAEQVGRRSEGRIQVITQSEVTALIGLEQTKALLGCSESSSQCLTEISNALGADGLVVGNVAKFGDSYAMTIKVLDAREAKPLFSASNTGMKEAQLVDWVKQVSIDLVAKIDPGKPAATASANASGPGASNGPASAEREPDRNSIWFSVLGIDYERRLKGPSWIGGRLAFSGGKYLGYDGYSLNAQVLAMARYMPLPADSKWMWSVYTGVGVGDIESWDSTTAPQGDWGFAATLGVEGGYQGLRASVEVMYTADTFTLIPGLSLALTF